MSKIIYSEHGIDVYDNGTILLIVCPHCKHENYAINVASGICTWCGYNAHEDAELKKRVTEHLNNHNK